LATLGHNIMEMRKKRDLTRDELAQKVFLTPGMIERIERDEIWPDSATLNRLAEGLGTEVSVLRYGPSRKRDKQKALQTVLHLTVVLLLLLPAHWFKSYAMDKLAATDNTAWFEWARLVTLVIYPILITQAGKLLMRLLERAMRVQEGEGEPDANQDVFLHGIIGLILIVWCAFMLVYLLSSIGLRQTMFSGILYDHPSLLAFCRRVTGDSTYAGIVRRFYELNDQYPIAYLAFLVAGAGLWATRRRKNYSKY